MRELVPQLIEPRPRLVKMGQDAGPTPRAGRRRALRSRPRSRADATPIGDIHRSRTSAGRRPRPAPRSGGGCRVRIGRADRLERPHHSHRLGAQEIRADVRLASPRSEHRQISAPSNARAVISKSAMSRASLSSATCPASRPGEANRGFGSKFAAVGDGDPGWTGPGAHLAGGWFGRRRPIGIVDADASCGGEFGAGPGVGCCKGAVGPFHGELTRRAEHDRHAGQADLQSLRAHRRPRPVGCGPA